MENSPVTYLGKTVPKNQISYARYFFLNFIVNGAQRNLDSVTNAKSRLEGMKAFLGGKHLESLLDFDSYYRFYLWVLNEFENSYRKTSKPKKKIVKKKNIEQDIQIAIEYIDFLSGDNYKGEKIMNDKDYYRLVEYLRYLIEYEAVPENIDPIPQMNTTNEYIRYTFFLIHKELYTTARKRKYFIDFLHEAFSQFGNTEWKTTHTKFSVKPNQYENDVMNPQK